jgi:hypothetical protein
VGVVAHLLVGNQIDLEILEALLKEAEELAVPMLR